MRWEAFHRPPHARFQPISAWSAFLRSALLVSGMAISASRAAFVAISAATLSCLALGVFGHLPLFTNGLFGLLLISAHHVLCRVPPHLVLGGNFLGPDKGSSQNGSPTFTGFRARVSRGSPKNESPKPGILTSQVSPHGYSNKGLPRVSRQWYPAGTGLPTRVPSFAGHPTLVFQPVRISHSQTRRLLVGLYTASKLRETMDPANVKERPGGAQWGTTSRAPP